MGKVLRRNTRLRRGKKGRRCNASEGLTESTRHCEMCLPSFGDLSLQFFRCGIFMIHRHIFIRGFTPFRGAWRRFRKSNPCCRMNTGYNTQRIMSNYIFHICRFLRTALNQASAETHFTPSGSSGFSSFMNHPYTEGRKLNYT